MSTEHQKYSTENQSKVIRKFAEQRGFEIVRTYADEGKSGLSIEGRNALKQLIRDVQTGSADYSVILVYDISRWGRFQDADESAFYEHICKRAGIRLLYCAEQFENDGSPVSTIVKGVKRAMAGEYSRELSAKVFAGQSHLIELGYRQGGPPGFGLRRMRVDHAGNRRGILERGEQKSIQTDRVILVPGPPDELEIIRWIYRMFVHDKRPERDIAAALNARSILTDLGRPWSRGTVHQVLINEKYIGNNVWNRVSCKLKRRRVHNTADMWVRANGVFEPVVDSEIFAAAQEIIGQRADRLSNDEMIDKLKCLYDRLGYLSGLVIDESDNLPSSSSYQNRFGSLIRVYQLVGFTPDRDYEYIEINRAIRRMHPGVLSRTIDEIARNGGNVLKAEETDLLQINDEFTVSIVIARCHVTGSGSLQWHIRFDTGLKPDITVALRMNQENSEPLDYYLLPRLDIPFAKIKLTQDNGISLDAYRFPNLDYLYSMAARVKLPEVA